MSDETVNSEEPTLVKKRAIDVLPYVNAIWCTLAGSKPFANTIENRSWSEDGSKIWFMLGSHNFYDADPEAEIEVVEVKCSVPTDLQLCYESSTGQLRISTHGESAIIMHHCQVLA